MPGKNPRLNPLASRKQLLLAESELNRALLAGNLTALTADVRALGARAKSLGSITSTAAMLVAVLAAFRKARSAGPAAKTSRWQAVIKGAGLVSTLWLALRRRGDDQARPSPASLATHLSGQAPSEVPGGEGGGQAGSGR